MNESSQAPAQPENKTVQKNPYTLWFVIVAFAAPVVLAYGMYFLNYTPSSYSNLGQLITPVIDIDSLQLHSDGENPLERDAVTTHKWHMVYFADGSCDETCIEKLTMLRQINKVVGKNAYRLRRMVIHLAEPDAAFSGALAEQYPKMRQLHGDAGVIRSAMQGASETFMDDEIFIMDPIGNIMMRYPADVSYKWIVDDLNKLFKVSQIG